MDGRRMGELKGGWVFQDMGHDFPSASAAFPHPAFFFGQITGSYPSEHIRGSRISKSLEARRSKTQLGNGKMMCVVGKDISREGEEVGSAAGEF